MTHLLFILLADPPDKNAKTAELLAPILSGLAFILSAAAFIFTVIIQLKERKRNLRQTLSTSLSDIARINVEVSKLGGDNNENSRETVRTVKSYNAQRGTLVSVADFLIRENEKLVTDADCQLMANTYNDLGDVVQAKHYWEQAIRKALSPLQKHLHLRDYGAFLYNSNEEHEGRKLFESSLTCDLSGNDNDLFNLSETYLMWAGLERNFGNDSEYNRLITESKAQCSRIKHKGKFSEMSRLIDQATRRHNNEQNKECAETE